MGKQQFRPRKHRQGVPLSKVPKTKESRIRERRKTGLEAAYHKIDTNMRVKRFRARQRIEVMKMKNLLTREQAEQNVRKECEAIEKEKTRLKTEAAEEYERLLQKDESNTDMYNMDSDEEDEVEADDRNSDEVLSESDDGSDSSFVSEREDVSDDEELNKEEMRASFRQVWAYRTNEIASKIKRIEVLGDEEDEDPESDMDEDSEHE
jgi:hypothetical protein